MTQDALKDQEAKDRVSALASSLGITDEHLIYEAQAAALQALDCGLESQAMEFAERILRGTVAA